MADYKNILIALDFSDEIDAIIKKALTVSTKNTKFYVIHAIDPMELGLFGAPYTGVLVNTAEIEREVLNFRKAELIKISEKFELNVEMPKLAIGKPARQIKNYAEEISADLIVLGTHGKHGLELLLGSTANGVLHGAPCDVLTVQIRANKQ